MYSPDITMIPADGRCERVWLPRFTTTHLRVPGAAKALCGSGPRYSAETWQVIAPGSMPVRASLPACRVCELAHSVAAAVAGGNTRPADRAGIIARVAWHGYMVPVSECARCERLRPIRGRGVCDSCRKTAQADGTLGQYGWTRADRLAEFAQFRRGGLTVPEASARAGVSERTGWRYEHAITVAGETRRAAA